jgi:hypothetical protein
MKLYIILITLILITLQLNSLGQEKYILYSLPTYDSLGNIYQTQRTFDHIPTKQDSFQFEIESRKYIRNWIDSEYKPQVILPKKRYHIKRYNPKTKKN